MQELINKIKRSKETVEIPSVFPHGIQKNFPGGSVECGYPDGTECQCDCSYCPCRICR